MRYVWDKQRCFLLPTEPSIVVVSKPAMSCGDFSFDAGDTGMKSSMSLGGRRLPSRQGWRRLRLLLLYLVRRRVGHDDDGGQEKTRSRKSRNIFYHCSCTGFLLVGASTVDVDKRGMLDRSSICHFRVFALAACKWRMFSIASSYLRQRALIRTQEIRP